MNAKEDEDGNASVWIALLVTKRREDEDENAQAGLSTHWDRFDIDMHDATGDVGRGWR
jgi:hypothetical protein